MHTIYMYIYIYIYDISYVSVRIFSFLCLGPHGPGPNWPPWAPILLGPRGAHWGQAHEGLDRPGPNGPPWALVGWALIGPPWALKGKSLS